MRVMLILILVFGVDGGFSAQAEKLVELPRLALGVEDSWPPYAKANGEGISVELVKAALESVDQPVEFHIKPYARVLREIESGQLDGGFNVTRQASTEKRFVFGDAPLLVAHGSFFFSPDRVWNFETQDQIPDGARVGVIIDYEYGNQYEFHRTRFKETRVSSQRQLVRMLLAGRLDMVIMFDRVARYTLVEMDLPEDALVKGVRSHSSDIYVVFSRRNTFARDYARLLEFGLQRIRDSGKYADILTNND